MSTPIERKLESGRLAIPVLWRNLMELENNSMVELRLEGKELIIKKKQIHHDGHLQRGELNVTGGY